MRDQSHMNTYQFGEPLGEKNSNQMSLPLFNLWNSV